MVALGFFVTRSRTAASTGETPAMPAGNDTTRGRTTTVARTQSSAPNVAPDAPKSDPAEKSGASEAPRVVAASSPATLPAASSRSVPRGTPRSSAERVTKSSSKYTPRRLEAFEPANPYK